MFCSSYLDARLVSPGVVTDEGRVFVDVAGPWVVCSLFKKFVPFLRSIGTEKWIATPLWRISLCVLFPENNTFLGRAFLRWVVGSSHRFLGMFLGS
jgi:hypothetical protein